MNIIHYKHYFQEIADVWLKNKNNITPQDITPGSNKNYWWICIECNKEYQEKVVKQVEHYQKINLDVHLAGALLLMNLIHWKQNILK